MTNAEKPRNCRLLALLLFLAALAIAVGVVLDGKCREEPVPADPKDPPPREPGVPVTPPAPPTTPPVSGPTTPSSPAKTAS